MSEQDSPQLRTRSTDNISVSDYCSLTNSRGSPVSLSPVPFYHSPPRSCSPVYDGINVYTSKNYDIHIKAIRAEQEQVQRKTFKNFINSIVPGCIISDIVDEFRDGVVLSRLIETLTGDKLKIERSSIVDRNRTHFICTVKTGLKYLENREIKLVNINPSDIVDGKPSIVLGLVWTLILNFYIRTHLAELELYFDEPDGVSSYVSTSPSESPRNHSSYPKHRIKQILLEKLGEKFGLRVNNFDRAWRDGRAFLSLTDRIVPRLFALEKGNQISSNRERLAFAFDLAEKHLGIAKLIDPSDVDVPSPDEKSIMTYISQFIPKEITRRKSILTQEDLESITRTLKNTPSSSFSCQDLPHYLLELSSHDIVETSSKIEHKKRQQKEEFQSYQHNQLREECYKLDDYNSEQLIVKSEEVNKHRKLSEQKFKEFDSTRKDQDYQNINERKFEYLERNEESIINQKLGGKKFKKLEEGENGGKNRRNNEQKQCRNEKSEKCQNLNESDSVEPASVLKEKEFRKLEDQEIKGLAGKKEEENVYGRIVKDEKKDQNGDEGRDKDENQDEDDEDRDEVESEKEDQVGDEDGNEKGNEDEEYRDHRMHKKHRNQRIEITLDRSALLAAPMLDSNDNEIKSSYDERRTVSAPPTPRRYVIRRRRRQILKTLYGGLKAALPIPFMIFLLAGVSTLIPSFEEDFDCVFMNNLRSSLRATLDYPNGPPPL